MSKIESLKTQIKSAFAHVEYPGDDRLRNSNMGDEPYLLEEEFKGKTDRDQLSVSFLDQAPDGFGSSLSFFSPEAFRFYLPCYLIADLDDLLQQQTPEFHLTFCFSDENKNRLINPLVCGLETWHQSGCHQFAEYSHEEVAAIVAYLNHKKEQDDFVREMIEPALNNYWLERLKLNQ